MQEEPVEFMSFGPFEFDSNAAESAGGLSTKRGDDNER